MLGVLGPIYRGCRLGTVRNLGRPQKGYLLSEEPRQRKEYNIPASFCAGYKVPVVLYAAGAAKEKPFECPIRRRQYVNRIAENLSKFTIINVEF